MAGVTETTERSERNGRIARTTYYHPRIHRELKLRSVREGRTMTELLEAILMRELGIESLDTDFDDKSEQIPA